VLLGAGGMNLRSNASGLGKDSDPELHFGVGVKYAILQSLSARFDFRDNLMQENRANPSIKDGDLVQNFELLLGLSFTLGRTGNEAAPAPKDSDGDGFFGSARRLPGASQAWLRTAAPRRSRRPSIRTKTAFQIHRSLPDRGRRPRGARSRRRLPEQGSGRRRLPERRRQVPEREGHRADGCPVHDKDADGIADDVDKCPDQPETKNGFQDADGCPDELPKEIARFAGVIKGIEFDFAKATIRKESNKVLDDAIKVLKQYPELRIMVSGHTDNVGDAQKNIDLSQERANSVKEYMVGKGIETGRIETRGAGPNEPVADNSTDKGRQENRRIEFKLLQK